MSLKWWSAARSALLVGILLALAVAVGACGGDDKSNSGSADAPAGEKASDPAASEPDNPLTIAGWGGAFTKASQTNFVDAWVDQADGVGAEFLDAPGTQVAKTLAQAQAGKVEYDLYDAIVAGDAFTLEKKGLLAPMPADVKAKMVEAVGEEKVSDFGLNLGSTSFTIVCNKEKVGTCPKNMTEFFDTKKFPQSRSIPGVAPFSLVTMALVAEGMPVGDAATSDVDLDKAFAALERIKPTVKVFWESGEQQEQIMRSGEVDLGLFYNARGFRLRKTGMDIDVAWAGCVYEAAYWAVTKDSDQPNRAFSLMEFIATHPEQQAAFAEEIGYSVPSAEAIDMLKPADKEQSPDNPANFEQMAQPNWGWFVDNADEVNKRMETYIRG
ncbi:MAG: putative spermidine/putrescine transport system substrate-binding protein [Thermoleophilaceae bacterium]|nr:putative spermidine/putrescine transport system substrate-binding protein [Thermoleophilaceae bacterium]